MTRDEQQPPARSSSRALGAARGSSQRQQRVADESAPEEEQEEEELLLSTCSGRLRLCQLSARPLVGEAEAAPLLLLVTMRDVTHLPNLFSSQRQQLERSEQRCFVRDEEEQPAELCDTSRGSAAAVDLNRLMEALLGAAQGPAAAFEWDLNTVRLAEQLRETLRTTTESATAKLGATYNDSSGPRQGQPGASWAF